MKAHHVYLTLFVLWLMFLVYPPVAMPFGFLVYGSFIALMACSAGRYRDKDWLSGILLCLLLATLPCWVLGFYGIYERFASFPIDDDRRALPDSFDGTKAGAEREMSGVKLCWCPPGKFT